MCGPTANNGDCSAARSILSQALAVSLQHPKSAHALLQMGLCAAQMGQTQISHEQLRELWWRYPLSSESLEAEKLLTQKPDPAFMPTMEERFQRGMSMYNKGALNKAVQELEKVEELSRNSFHYYKSQITIAKALVRLKKYDQAEVILQKLIEISSSQQDEAWIWLGRTYLRHGKGKDLEKLVKTLPINRLTGDQQAQLYVFYGIWLEDHDRWPEALAAFENAAHVAQGPSRKVEALWKVGWIQYQREQFPEAIRIFHQIIHATTDSRSLSLKHMQSQAWYWLARSEDHLGRVALANQHLGQIRQASPMTYYGQLAQVKLGVREDALPSEEELVSNNLQGKNIPLQLLQDEHFQKLQALRDVQLSSEAIKELEQVYSRHGSDTEAFSHVMALAGEIRAYDIGIRLAMRHFGQTVRSGTLDEASPAWSGAFPMGYHSIIQAVVPPHVDPFLVSGLIREESLYSARVVSPVGAVGLMQLMPATAKRVARQLKLSYPEFFPNSLYMPQYNIQLGTHYLGQLLKEFGGNIIHSVAAYNAGPRAVQQWIAKHGHRPGDEFVELIGYRETRGYVKRVIGSYRIYRMLYGKSCGPVSLDRFC